MTSLQCAAKEHLGTHCMLDALEDMLFVIDLETYEMRYMNAPARAAFGYEEGAYAGRKCYQVLQGFSQPCVFCQNHLPSEQGFKTWENQNVRLHRRFLIRDKIIQWDGRPARLEIYQAPAAQEEARENAEHVLLEMAGLLLSAESLEDGIQGTLERLGGFYGADRCYVVQARLGERTFQAAQQWQSPALQARGNAAAQTLEGAGWLEHLKARHLVACHDVEQLQQVFPEKYRDMRARGVRSFYAVALLEEGILARINGITSRYQVDRRLLKLEITESIGDVERRILEEISREIVGDGYCLSLDDFGAQYSNLSILSSLQLSELKIDKSIINDLYSNQNTRILVEHLIHICRQLGIDSVAEGVEEREQLQILEDIGCTYAQGYLYNKPIPVPDFERKYLAGPGNDP